MASTWHIMSRACWRKRTNIWSVIGRLKISFLILFCPNFTIILRCFQGVIRSSFRSFDLEESFLVKASFPAAHNTDSIKSYNFAWWHNNDKLWQIKHLADQENISKSTKYFHSIHSLNYLPEWFEPSYFLALWGFEENKRWQDREQFSYKQSLKWSIMCEPATEWNRTIFFGGREVRTIDD